MTTQENTQKMFDDWIASGNTITQCPPMNAMGSFIAPNIDASDTRHSARRSTANENIKQFKKEVVGLEEFQAA